MKKLCSFLIVVLLSMFLTAFGQAAPLNYVADTAGLLDAGQKADLETRIKKVRNNFNFDLVIVTLEDAQSQKEPLVFTADYYRDKGYGVGESRDGLILLLDMKARDWAIVGMGHGQTVFTGWGTSYIGKEILPYLGNGKYYEAFGEFLTWSERFLQAYAEGDPITEKNPYLDSTFYGILIALAAFAAVGVAFYVKKHLSNQMKTVSMQYTALDYVKSIDLSKSEDNFLYDQVTTVKKAKANSGSGSVPVSRGSFKSSSGSSHSGSSGKF